LLINFTEPTVVESKLAPFIQLDIAQVYFWHVQYALFLERFCAIIGGGNREGEHKKTSGNPRFKLSLFSNEEHIVEALQGLHTTTLWPWNGTYLHYWLSHGLINRCYKN